MDSSDINPTFSHAGTSHIRDDWGGACSGFGSGATGGAAETDDEWASRLWREMQARRQAQRQAQAAGETKGRPYNRPRDRSG